MNNKETEREVAYLWKSEPQIITGLKMTMGWKRNIKRYQLVDSIYDTDNRALSRYSIGARVRTNGSTTLLTAKKYIGDGDSGESIFEERSKKLSGHTHPNSITAKDLNLNIKPEKFYKQFQFINNRVESRLRKNSQSILLINDEVTYANNAKTYTDHILEVEFKNVSPKLIKLVRNELESSFKLELLNEGKVDRASRFLAN